MLNAGLWTLDSGRWILLLLGNPVSNSAWSLSLKIIWCNSLKTSWSHLPFKKYVLTCLVLEFLYQRYVSHKKTPTEKKCYYEKLVYNKSSYFEPSIFENLSKNASSRVVLTVSQSRAADWQSRADMLYENGTTTNVFLEIFRNFLEHLDIIVCTGKYFLVE